MKSKKFEDLRGTKTAIYCKTKSEARQVENICEFSLVSKYWENFKENFAISLSEESLRHNGFFLEVSPKSMNDFVFIPAADFIAANSPEATECEKPCGMNYCDENGCSNRKRNLTELSDQPEKPTPNLTGTRPAIEWLQFLPEPYRGKALEAVKVAPFSPNKICKYNDCVFYSISWTEIKNDSLWEGSHYHLHNPEKHPLPPLPSEGVEAEKVEAEKTETIKRPSKEEISEFVKNLLITVDEQRIKIESLEKQLSEKPDTAEPDILLTPAEPEVKLPVTIEERDAYCNTLVDGKRIFTHVKQEFAVLHKKTCNKTNAFLTLLKIAEAQNEIVPRGEWVYYAEYEIAKDKIKPRKRVMDTTAYGYGLITFHSEQGLKDCIEANRELWMDLLKSE